MRMLSISLGCLFLGLAPVLAEDVQLPNDHELIVCGWDRVMILDLDDRNEGIPRTVWNWQGATRTDLPERFHSLFRTTNDCKSCDGGRKILITASGGAVVYVDRVADRVLFHAEVPNAHSAELLPGGRIAVAASHRREKGDRLLLFDIRRSDEVLWAAELPWGHGVVWDEKRKRLWALSGADIRVFRLDEWDTAKPKLRRTAVVPLPEKGGHELSPVPGTSSLWVSTASHCWLFDRDTRKFSPHPELSDHAGVKCISRHPTTGRTVYVQAEGDHWWAERLHFFDPQETIHIPGEHFYKARWLAPVSTKKTTSGEKR